MRDAEAFGRLRAAVRTTRKSKGLSQAGLAELAGVGTATVQRLESARYKTDTDKILKILEALGLDAGVFGVGASTKNDHPQLPGERPGMTSPDTVAAETASRGEDQTKLPPEEVAVAWNWIDVELRDLEADVRPAARREIRRAVDQVLESFRSGGVSPGHRAAQSRASKVG